MGYAMAQPGSGFLQGFVSQGQQVWSSLSVPQRVTLVMFVIGSVVLLALVGFWSGNPNYVPLVADLSPEEVTGASAKLRDAQIPFRYEAGRGVLSVPSGKLDDARLALAELGLPAKGRDGFQVFDQQSFGMTDFAQKVNYLRALQASLEGKVAALGGIESAHVTLTLPTDDLFLRDRQPPKASVEVKARRGHDISPGQVAAIRHIISAAVPKLDPTNVAVMDADGRLLARFQSAEDVGAVAGDKLEARIRTEGYLRQKIESLLEQALGPGRAAVQVAAEMSFESVERRTQRMDPDSGVILQETLQSNDSQGGAGTTVGGTPGVRANTPGADGAVTTSGGAAGQSKKQKTVSNSYHYDTITETVKPEVGRVARIAVAVLVKPKTVEEGGATKVVPLSTAELNSLTEAVKNAVGYTAERKDVVRVENAPEAAPALPSVAAPTSVVTGPSVLQDLKNQVPDVAAVLGVIVLAFLLWRTMRRLTVSSETYTATVGEQLSVPTQRNSATSNSPVYLQNRIQDLVGKNTEQATDIIRSLLQK
jgi:flagellar M-ring protein FliF